jgi:hypothetical protein
MRPIPKQATYRPKRKRIGSLLIALILTVIAASAWLISTSSASSSRKGEDDVGVKQGETPSVSFTERARGWQSTVAHELASGAGAQGVVEPLDLELGYVKLDSPPPTPKVIEPPLPVAPAVRVETPPTQNPNGVNGDRPPRRAPGLEDR